MHNGKAIVRVSDPRPWYGRSRQQFNDARTIAPGGVADPRDGA